MKQIVECVFAALAGVAVMLLILLAAGVVGVVL